MIAATNNGKIKHISEEEQQKMYLDWINNFLSIDKFAQYYEISYFSASSLLKKQRKRVEITGKY